MADGRRSGVALAWGASGYEAGVVGTPNGLMEEADDGGQTDGPDHG